MKSILLVGMTSGVGGVETFISNLVNLLDKQKFEVNLLLFQRPNSRYKDVLSKAANVYYVNAINKHPLIYLKDVIRLYRKHHFDIVHLSECTAKLFVYCWPVIFDRKVNLVIHSHNGNTNTKKEVAHYLLRPIQKIFANYFWSCSTKATNWMFGSKKGVILIKNGIDSQKYSFSSATRKEYRKKLSITDDELVVGSVARLERQKNHDFVIDIFNRLLQQKKNAKLILVGDGSLKRQIMDKVRQLNLENNVEFLGNREDVPKILQVFDVLLMPSLYEGLPFVGLEAQAAGLPLLVSNTVDHELDITGHVTFLSLNQGSVEWSKKLVEVAGECKRKDGNFVRKCFKNKGYDVETTVHQIENLYEMM